MIGQGRLANIWFAVQNSHMGFPGGSVVKNWPASIGDLDSIPGLRTSPRVGNGNPLQYSCLENPMDGGACWATMKNIAHFSKFESITFCFACVGQVN